MCSISLFRNGLCLLCWLNISQLILCQHLLCIYIYIYVSICNQTRCNGSAVPICHIIINTIHKPIITILMSEHRKSNINWCGYVFFFNFEPHALHYIQTFRLDSSFLDIFKTLSVSIFLAFFLFRLNVYI